MTLYKAPDIRKRTLEQEEEFISDKRVRRMIMAASYQQTKLEKANKLHDAADRKFHKQAELFEKDMDRVEEIIERMQRRLEAMNEINTEMTNVEGVIAEGQPADG